jgi:hypothetical protein
MAVETNVPPDLAALETPAPFVNRFQIMDAGANIRIAFAENFSGQQTFYRSAVMMSAQDARELAEAILTTLPPQYRNALAEILKSGGPTYLTSQPQGSPATLVGNQPEKPKGPGIV